MRPVHPLKLRRRALSMRLLDVQNRYGIASSTWASWEKFPGEPGHRMPDQANMRRICTEIFPGEIFPNDFYGLAPVSAGPEPLAAEGG